MTTTIVNGKSYIDQAMMEYSAEVLLNRAIPVLQDGLKPVYRRILSSMYMHKEVHLTKTANVAGKVMELHPHGSASGTIIEMVQKDRNLVPLLDGNGNFGQFTSKDIQPAADRYSEVKLSNFAKNQLKYFNGNIVRKVKNFDGTIEVPEVLPVTFPLILMYCTQGIGVGYASQTLSFNMNDIAKLIHNIIRNKRIIIYPDFATGGMIDRNDEDIKKILETGRGRINLRAKIQKFDKEHYLLVTEIPYGEKRENIIDKIVKVYQKGKITEVRNIKDLSDLHGQKIKIELQKNANLNSVIQKLYRYTSLQSSLSANMNIIDITKGSPEVMGVYDVATRWLKWRFKCYRLQLQNELKDYENELEILKGYLVVKSNLDKIINIIQKSKKSSVIMNLCNNGLTKKQADVIVETKLYNLNKETINEKIKKIPVIEKICNEYGELLNDKEKMLLNIDKQIEDIAKKFGGDRKTQIMKFDYEKIDNVIKKEQHDDNSLYNIFITNKGFVYKTTNESVKTLLGDKVIWHKQLHNNAIIDIICDNDIGYGIRLNEIKEQNNSLTKLESLCDYHNENILGIIYHDENEDDKIIYGYGNGKMVKVPLESFPIKSRKIKNVFAKNQTLAFCYQTNEAINIRAFNDNEKHIISSLDVTEKKNRASVGNFVIQKNRNQEINTQYEVEK